MSISTGEGPISWVADLINTTTTTAVPSGASAGIACSTALMRDAGVGAVGSRVHVAVDYNDTTAATSCTILLFGYADRYAFTTTPAWLYIGGMNGGASMAPIVARDGTLLRMLSTAVFNVSGDNYSRYATRSYLPAGTAPKVSTWIGFPVG